MTLVDLEAASTIQIRDPRGNILQAGDPGVQILEQDGCTSIYVDIPTVYTPNPGETAAPWEIILDGTGPVSLRAVAQTGLHLDYLGDHVLNSGREARMRVRLSTASSASPFDPATVEFQLLHATNSQTRDISLYDDGQHGDGAAGDGLYGGLVAVPRGIWYLAAAGTLSDGSAFTRLHDIPLRVKGFAGQKSPDSGQVAGNGRSVQFAITNDSAAALSRAANQVYELGLDSSLGWATAPDLPPTISLAPGETRLIRAQITVPPNAVAGEVEETTLLVMEAGDLAASETLSVNTTVVENMSAYLPMTIGP